MSDKVFLIKWTTEFQSSTFIVRSETECDAIRIATANIEKTYQPEEYKIYEMYEIGDM